MSIFDGNMPYSNLHELNNDWIIKTVKEVKEKAETIDESVAQAKQSEENAKTSEENAESYADAAEDSKGNITPGELDELLTDFTISYYYSLENDTLTLTEREFGEQTYTFTRIEK